MAPRPAPRSRRPLPRLLGLLALLACVGTPPLAGEDALVPTLEEGRALAVVLRQGRSTFTARVQVPPEAVSLAVVATADGDVDLFLKQGRPVLDDFEAQADAFRRGEGGAEILVLHAEHRATPLHGVWYVTLEHPGAAARPTSAELVVLFDRRDGPRSVLPGHPVVSAIGAGASAELRTLLPSRARGLTLTVLGRGVEGAALEARAEGGLVRRSPAELPLTLEGDEVAPGVVGVTVRPAVGLAPARKVTTEVAWTFPPLPQPSDAPLLSAGRAELVLLGGDSPHARLYRVEVPPGTGGFLLEEHNDARADVDLYVRRDAPPEVPERDADWLAVSSAPAERLVVRGQRALAPGTFFVHVSIYAEGPVLSSLELRWLPEAAPERTWGAAEPPGLSPGAWAQGRTDPATSGIRWYAVDPPSGARSIHALLLDAAAPLDLVLARRTDGSVLSRAVTGRVDERLDHAFPAPLPADKRFLLGVVSLTPGEGPAEFRVAVGFDRPPELPGDLVWPQLLPREGLNADERVAAATVELTGERSGGGSATCLSPRGLLLSCRHVLEDPEEPGRLQRDAILVAFSRALDRPPAQCYLARVVSEDAALDLALLELTEDVFGRALPENPDLPWVPLGDSDALRLGDPVTVFGYPQEGSEATRTPVILSRGVVSGFESAGGRRTWIKTDAWIGPGHSGGTLVDGQHRLVGVPAATLGARESMGLCVPVSRLPAAWRERLARDLR